MIREPSWVKDCVVVGVPDRRWGEAVAAVVEVAEGSQPDTAAIVGAVKARLAGYKAPRHVVFAPVERGHNGKASHPRAREIAAREIATR